MLELQITEPKCTRPRTMKHNRRGDIIRTCDLFVWASALASDAGEFVSTLTRLEVHFPPNGFCPRRERLRMNQPPGNAMLRGLRFPAIVSAYSAI